MDESNKNASEPLKATALRGGRGPLEKKSVHARHESRHWWIKLFVQPLLLLTAGAALIAGIGVAQRLGWISAGGGSATHVASSGGASTRYICPMMCTPPQAEPGRCPVCAMELVPAASGGGETDSRSVEIDPVARRLANIHTVTVRSMPLVKTIRAVGELGYDEGALKTISAYVDGRIERLDADYTGVVVAKGDPLALLYSPRLYTAQVELLVARKLRDENRPISSERATDSNRDIYQSSKQRLIELGMTPAQIEQLERTGEANSRLQISAPISGTVIEKLAVEGQYVKEGQAIYNLADLSTVWLMLELFPEDAAAIHNDQKVDAEVQSLPGRKFTGRVAFIDPNVDPSSRTVGVRVVIPNEDGLLRVGDYAKATVHIPVDGGNAALVVPRSAVLLNGGHSVVYVESEPGRFEIRLVVLGGSTGDQTIVLEGLQEGEQVATAGNFLIDSQMQLVGNPSLLDPTKAEPKGEESNTAEIVAALDMLSPTDRERAELQRICPVTDFRLGSMGTPPKVEVNGQTVFLCCEGCREALLEEPEKYLKLLAEGSAADGSQGEVPQMDLPPIGEMELVSPSSAEPQGSEQQADQSKSFDINASFSQLSPEDRQLAFEQRVCPVAGTPLGSMGVPVKVIVQGRPVFICCEGCRKKLLAEPTKYLAKLEQEAVR